MIITKEHIGKKISFDGWADERIVKAIDGEKFIAEDSGGGYAGHSIIGDYILVIDPKKPSERIGEIFRGQMLKENPDYDPMGTYVNEEKTAIEAIIRYLDEEYEAKK